MPGLDPPLHPCVLIIGEASAWNACPVALLKSCNTMSQMRYPARFKAVAWRKQTPYWANGKPTATPSSTLQRCLSRHTLGLAAFTGAGRSLGPAKATTCCNQGSICASLVPRRTALMQIWFGWRQQPQPCVKASACRVWWIGTKWGVVLWLQRCPCASFRCEKYPHIYFLCMRIFNPHT